MKNLNKGIKILLFASLVIVVGIVGYLIGNKQVNNDLDNQNFYAIIETINDNNMLVSGIEDNDINYRTKYSFNVKDTTILEWRGTKLKLSDFKVGDRISITFNGPVLDSYPGQITNVLKIQLLSDREAENLKQKNFTIVDETEECDTALELLYEDDYFKYYFNCLRSTTTFIVFDDGSKYTIKEAINNNMITINEIIEKIKGTDQEYIIYKEAK